MTEAEHPEQGLTRRSIKIQQRRNEIKILCVPSCHSYGSMILSDRQRMQLVGLVHQAIKQLVILGCVQ